MTVWPFLPVWPFLLALCVLASLRNWRAGLLFAACILGVRGILEYDVAAPLSLPQPIIAHMVLYSVMAVIGLFWVEKTAGAVLAVVSALMGLAIFGFISHRAEIIASEFVIVLGLAASAFLGPNRGIFARVGSRAWRGLDPVVAGKKSRV